VRGQCSLNARVFLHPFVEFADARIGVDLFLDGRFNEFVELLPAQQTENTDWYQGTADAVYQNFEVIRRHDPKLILVLAGDHVYKMDYTCECAPVVKTGGLGDVSAALPFALREFGLDARVLLPGYPSVLAAAADAPEAGTLEVLGFSIRLFDARLPSGVPLLVADCPKLYARGGGPYQADDGDDWDDNAVRFGVFSKLAAVLGSSTSPLDWRPDVVHCNDWPRPWRRFTC